jgi:hypothetical protein
MKRFKEFLVEKHFWGDSWKKAKDMPPEYDVQEPDKDLDVYKSKAIQALTELRERTQDADFHEMLDDMIHIIQHHSMADPKDGPMGTTAPSFPGDVFFGQDGHIPQGKPCGLD